MSNLINEAKRMQHLAGIVTESQLNEVEAPAWLIQDILKNKHVEGKSNRGGVEIKVGLKNVLPKKTYTSMQEIREKIGEVTKVEGDKVTIKTLTGEEFQYPAESLILVSGLSEALDIEEIANEALKSIKEATPNAPADVAALGKAQSTASTVSSKAKAINNINEFPGAFENWFKTLGFQPGKVSKSAVRSAVEKVLTNLGYK